MATKLEGPQRVKGYTQEAEIDGIPVILSTNERDDGRLVSIRLTVGKQTVEQVGMIDSLCAAINLGLQNGVPLEDYVDEFVFTRFRPSGLVVGNEKILKCTSILDYVFRELAVSYLDRDDLADVATGADRRRAGNLVRNRVVLADLLVRKAADLSLISGMLEDQLGDLLAELEARIPNEEEAHSRHLDRMNSIRALRELTSEVNDEIISYSKGLRLDRSMKTAAKVITLRDRFGDLVAANKDLVDSGIRVSVAGGFIAFFSAVGADMTFATPGLLALFGGSKVVKIVKEILSRESKD